MRARPFSDDGVSAGGQQAFEDLNEDVDTNRRSGTAGRTRDTTSTSTDAGGETRSTNRLGDAVDGDSDELATDRSSRQPGPTPSPTREGEFMNESTLADLRAAADVGDDASLDDLVDAIVTGLEERTQLRAQLREVSEVVNLSVILDDPPVFEDSDESGESDGADESSEADESDEE
jgi:hypothetical protein